MKIVLGRVHQMRGLNGGMENVCARMANEMIKRGHDVTVISDGLSYTHLTLPTKKEE